MKMLMVALALSLPVFAKQDDKKAARFEEAKAKILKEMDRRISQFTKSRACIAGAKDRDAMKACRADLKEFREENKQRRKEWQQKRKKMKTGGEE